MDRKRSRNSHCSGFSERKHAARILAPRRLAVEPLENRMLLDAGGLDSDGIVDAAVDLGDLVFYRDEHVDLLAGDVAYEFRATYDAELTVDATDTDSDCTISLYGSDLRLLEQRHVSEENSASSRVDYSATAGEKYYVSVSGDDDDLEVRIGNQIGGPGAIYGSAFDDVFEIIGSTVTINDIEYGFSVPAVIGAEPIRFAIDGAEGNDTVLLQGYGSTEMHVRPDSVSWKTNANEVEAEDVEYVHGYARGESGVAYLHGSPERDKLKVQPGSDLVKLIGSDYLSRAKFFEQVVVDAGEGEDLARIWDTEDNDQFYFHPDDSGFQFASMPDWDVRGYGFENTMVWCSAGGTDWTALHDSEGDDLLFARSHKAKWSGPGFNVVLRGMSFLEAYSMNGGDDRAKLHGTSGDDQFETLGNQAGLSTWDNGFVPRYRVRDFEWVKAYAHTGNEDICSLDAEAEFETVLDGDWIETPRDELTKYLVYDGGSFF